MREDETEHTRTKRCEFCNEKGNIQEQDMGEGRIMHLCASCRRYIADGKVQDKAIELLKDALQRFIHEAAEGGA